MRLFAIAELRAYHLPRLERIDFAELRRILISPHDLACLFDLEEKSAPCKLDRSGVVHNEADLTVEDVAPPWAGGNGRVVIFY